MKNLLTQRELRRKTDHKLEPRGLLLLLGFVGRAVGKWPAALLSGSPGPSCRRSNHRGLGPSRVAGLAALLFCPAEPSHWRCNVNKRQNRFGERKNDRLIGKKPPNPIGTKEENRCKKILIVVQSSGSIFHNQSFVAASSAWSYTTLFAVHLCGWWCIDLHYSICSPPLWPVVHRVR